MEHFAFNAGESKNRQVDHRDDDHAKDRRPDHFARRGRGQREPLLLGKQAPEPVLSFAKPPEAVFNNDHRAIYDQAKIKRAEAHEVARDPVADHACHGERNDRRCQQRGPDIAEQQEEDDDHEERPLGEVFLDGGDRCVDEVGAIVDRADRNTFRQARTNGIDLLIDRNGYSAAVLTDQHEGRTEHDFFAVLGGGACA